MDRKALKTQMLQISILYRRFQRTTIEARSRIHTCCMVSHRFLDRHCLMIPQMLLRIADLGHEKHACRMEQLDWLMTRLQLFFLIYSVVSSTWFHAKVKESTDLQYAGYCNSLTSSSYQVFDKHLSVPI